MNTAIPARPVVRIIGIVLVLIGLYLTVGGGWLVALGGSPYYVITGIALILTGVLLFCASAVALWLYALVVLGTLIWAIWEVGLDFWPLVPRGGLLVMLDVWLLMPWIGRGLSPGSSRLPRSRTRTGRPMAAPGSAIVFRHSATHAGQCEKAEGGVDIPPARTMALGGLPATSG